MCAIIGLIFLIISAFFTDDEYAYKSIAFVIGLLMFTLSLGYSVFTKGKEQGAYDQLRGKYEVTYVMDKDSYVIDTVIHVK